MAEYHELLAEGVRTLLNSMLVSPGIGEYMAAVIAGSLSFAGSWFGAWFAAKYSVQSTFREGQRSDRRRVLVQEGARPFLAAVGELRFVLRGVLDGGRVPDSIEARLDRVSEQEMHGGAATLRYLGPIPTGGNSGTWPLDRDSDPAILFEDIFFNLRHALSCYRGKDLQAVDRKLLIDIRKQLDALGDVVKLLVECLTTNDQNLVTEMRTKLEKLQAQIKLGFQTSKEG